MQSNPAKSWTESDMESEYYAESSLYEYLQHAQFKRLLSQIRSAEEVAGVRSIAIMSEFPREGKTFFTSVLALGYASLLKRRVAIVDTVTPRRKRDWAPMQYPLHGDFIGSLHVNDVTPDASDFQIGEYIATLERDYDLILLDTCSLAAANEFRMDPFIISSHADAALFLTSKRSLGKDQLIRLRRDVSRWKINVLGTVHNEGAR
jgi:Mrp family chromosome partitioning ATPase